MISGFAFNFAHVIGTFEFFVLTGKPQNTSELIKIVYFIGYLTKCDDQIFLTFKIPALMLVRDVRGIVHGDEIEIL